MLKYQIWSVILFFLVYIHFLISIKRFVVPSYTKFKELFFYYKFHKNTIEDRQTQLLLFVEYVKSDAGCLKDFLTIKLFKEKTYVPSSFNTHDLLRFWKTSINKLTIFKLKRLERIGIHKPKFNLGKTYNVFYIFGIKKFENLYYLTDTFISCCLSNKEPIWTNFISDFDVDYLKKARQSIESSSLSRKKIFFLLKPYILNYKKTKTEKNLKKLLYKFNCAIKPLQLDEVKMLLCGLLQFANKNLMFNSVKFKLQNGELRDIFDNETTGCCSLAPTGKYWNDTYSAIDYLTNKNVALLHIKSYINNVECSLLGVAFLALCKTQTNEQVLLVDSLEIANYFLYDNVAAPNKINFYCLQSIKQVANEMKINHLFFCSTAVNSSAKKLVKFVQKTHKLDKNPTQLYLELLNTKERIYLDAFYDGGSTPVVTPKGVVTGYSVYIS